MRWRRAGEVACASSCPEYRRKAGVALGEGKVPVITDNLTARQTKPRLLLALQQGDFPLATSGALIQRPRWTGATLTKEDRSPLRIEMFGL